MILAARAAWLTFLIVLMAPAAQAQGPKGTIGIVCKHADGTSFTWNDRERRPEFLRCLDTVLRSMDTTIVDYAPIEHLIQGSEDLAGVRHRILSTPRNLDRRSADEDPLDLGLER